MEVLVSTDITQGARSNDYNYCVAGELVWVQEPCDRGRKRPHTDCGCGRGFAGLASHRATTTAQVVDLDITRDDLILAVRTSLTDGGWPEDWAVDVADDNVAIASAFPVTTIIERELDVFRPRTAVAGSSPPRR